MNNPFGGKTIALTGFGKSKTGWVIAGHDPVEEAIAPVKKLIKKVEGKYQKVFSDDVDYLVYDSDGFQDTPELLRAKELESSGKNIQILSYQAFTEAAFKAIFELWPTDKTIIKDKEFYDLCSLESITIPDCVTEIGNEAFGRCFNLKHITLPREIKVIGYEAFYGSKVDALEIPDGIEKIGYDAFGFEDEKVKSITIPSTLKELSSYNFRGIKDIRVFDSMKTGACMGGGNHLSEFEYTITVLSKETGEVKYVIPMFSYTNKELQSYLTDAWHEDRVEFDFKKIDDNFSRLKKSEGKATVAEYRLKYPIDLSEESRKAYESYLKRTAKKRAAEKLKDPNFVVKGTKLVEYKGNDSKVVIPEGVTEICKGAFPYRTTISEIVIPEGVTTIESLGISYDHTKSIILPDSVINIYTGSIDKVSDKGMLKLNQAENGLYLGNEKNPYVCLVKTTSKDIQSIKLAEGCRIITGGAFKDCRRLELIELPESIVRINEPEYGDPNPYLRRNLRMNMPKNYLKCSDKMPSTFTYDLVTTKWRDEATIEDYAWMYLYQGSKTLDELCEKKMGSDPNRAVAEMNLALNKHPKKASYKKAAEFVSKNKDQIDKDVAHSLYKGAVASKSNDAVDLLSFASGTGMASEAPTIIAEAKDVKVEGAKLIISEGVSTIPKGFLEKYINSKIEEIVLPDSVKLIDESALSMNLRINMPSGYALTKEKLPPKFTCDLMSRPWYKSMKLQDYAYLYIYQNGTNFKEMCLFELKWDPDKGVKELIKAVNDGGKSSHYFKIAEFIAENQENISIETTSAFIEAAKAAKAKKAVSLAETTLDKPKKDIPINRNEIEVFCHENFSEYANSCVLREAYVHDDVDEVKYKDSDKIAPEFVVHCAMAPYIELFKSFSDGIKLELLPKSDKVAAKLDQESYIEALAQIAEMGYWWHSQSVIPVCRYADEETAERIVYQINRGIRNYTKNYKRGAEVTSEAILLNDTEVAREYAKSIGRIKDYEMIHK